MLCRSSISYWSSPRFCSFCSVEM